MRHLKIGRAPLILKLLIDDELNLVLPLPITPLAFCEASSSDIEMGGLIACSKILRGRLLSVLKRDLEIVLRRGFCMTVYCLNDLMMFGSTLCISRDNGRIPVVLKVEIGHPGSLEVRSSHVEIAELMARIYATYLLM